MDKKSTITCGFLMGAIILLAPFESIACKKVKQENTELRSELEASRQRNAELETQLQEKYSLLEMENQEIVEMQNQIDMKNSELQRMYADVQILEKNVRELGDTLKARGDELSKQVANLAAEKQTLERQVVELKESIDAQLAAEAAKWEQMKATHDQLLVSLEKEIGQKTIEIQQFKDALTINIMDKIFFESGKAEIKPEGHDVLRRVGAILKNLPDKMIRIEGHTDDIPIGQKIVEKYPTNWELGAARAAKVAEFFRKEVGIDPKRITVVSYSMYRPLVPHTTKANRAKNRRIEIVVLNKLHYQMMEVKQSMEQ